MFSKFLFFERFQKKKKNEHQIYLRSKVAQSYSKITLKMTILYVSYVFSEDKVC